jgi:hypothetical protein
MKPKTWDELVEGVGRVWSGFRAWCKSTRSPVWAGTVVSGKVWSPQLSSTQGDHDEQQDPAALTPVTDHRVR